MSASKAAPSQTLLGRMVSGLMERLGIEPRRYWILVELFRKLSERREAVQQLGGMALLVVVGISAIVSSAMSLVMFAIGVPAATHFLIFLIFTLFILVAFLVPETADSLVNPVEGMILAHQPVNGATYTSAKLSHLFRIVVYVVLGMNGVPALLGTFLDGAPWFYAPLHLTAAFASSVVLALICCSLFGWLIRFVPVRRLKGIAMIAPTLPILAMAGAGPLSDLIGDAMPAESLSDVIFSDIVVRGYAVPGGVIGVLCGSFAVVALPAIFFGLRSLSGDYLIRVSGLVHSASATTTRPRRSGVGAWAARFSGGQVGRAGFEFIANLIGRDWRSKQSMAAMAPILIIGSVALLVLGRAVSPFSSDFAWAHLLPHLNGFAVASVCNVLAFGVDYKGVWVFQVAPDGSFSGFARGVHATLFAVLALIPHLIFLPITIWLWGPAVAAAFIAYSATVSALYLSLTLRLIDGIPFGMKFDQNRPFRKLARMTLGGFVVANRGRPAVRPFQVGRGRRCRHAVGGRRRVLHDTAVIDLFRSLDPPKPEAGFGRHFFVVSGNRFIAGSVPIENGDVAVRLGKIAELP